MSEHPQADKVSENRDRSQAIGEFLDWLRDEQGIVFCRWYDKRYYFDGKQISREEALALERPEGMLRFETPYEVDPEGFVPARETTLVLLAKFFDVDLQAYEAEKQQMLEEARELNS